MRDILSTPRPSAVLWDMDGTLIDSEPLWLECEHAMLARYGIEIPENLHEMLVGSGLRAAAALFQGFGVPLSIDEIIDEWAEGVIAGLHAGHLDWRPGAIELLQSLAAAGIPCALVTMSVRSIADAVVAALPEPLFTAVLGGDEVANEKPHPEPFRRGAELLGVPITECLALEDSPTGVRAARASGAIAIGVPNIVSLAEVPAHALWTTLDGVDAEVLSERFAALRAENPADSDPAVAPFTEAGVTK